MPSYSWTSGVSGDWSDSSNWSPAGVPGSSDSAAIAVGGSYVVTLDVGAVGSVGLDASGATLAVGGSTGLDGTLAVEAGTLSLAGTLLGGTLDQAGGAVSYAGGTLDGVTLVGPLDLSAASAQLTIVDGLTQAGGSAQILLTGAGSELTYADSETLSSTVMTLGGSSTAYLSAGATLTLAGSSSIDVAGFGSITGNELDNQGTITDSSATGYFADNLATLSNSGTIALSNGAADEFNGALSNSGTISIAGAGTVLDGGYPFENSGTVTVGSGATLSIDGTYENSGSISLSSGATLSLGSSETYAQLGTISNAGGTISISNGGTLDLTGQTLTVASGGEFDHLSLAGTLLGGTLDPAGGTLSFAGGTLDGVTLVGPLDLSAASAQGTIVDGLTQTGASPAQILVTGAGSGLIYADSETLASTALTLGNPSSTASLSTGATLTLAGSSSLDVAGDGAINGDTLDNEGTITDADTGYFAVSLNALINSGTIALSNDTLDRFDSTLSNSGTISVAGTGTAAQVDNGYAFENTGIVTIASGGLFDVATGTTALGTVAFTDATGTLRLDDITGGYTGTLSEFRQGDLVELGGSGQTLTQSGDTLDVDQNGGAVDSFTLAGFDYTGDTFSLVTDANGYQAITTDTPCFARGTRILTAQGERPVETLQVGDLVVTFCGQGAVLKPVRWLGHRSLDLARHPEPARVRPVRIAAGALAEAVPHRDLVVSPDHALLLDGALVWANNLINGATITQEAPDHVQYWHVELDRHSILLAEGAPAESYLDTGNRTLFDNNPVIVLRPEFVPAPTPAAACRRYAEPDPAAAARLVARAEALGWRRTEDPSPWLEADGVVVAPERLPGGYRFAVPAGSRQLRLRSRAGEPAAAVPGSRDRRRLGLSISGLDLHGPAVTIRIEPAHPALRAGFYPVERNECGCWRWTDGDAALALDDITADRITTLDVLVHAGTTFWTRPAGDEPAAIDQRCG